LLVVVHVLLLRLKRIQLHVEKVGFAKRYSPTVSVSATLN